MGNRILFQYLKWSNISLKANANRICGTALIVFVNSNNVWLLCVIRELSCHLPVCYKYVHVFISMLVSLLSVFNLSFSQVHISIIISTCYTLHVCLRFSCLRFDHLTKNWPSCTWLCTWTNLTKSEFSVASFLIHEHAWIYRCVWTDKYTFDVYTSLVCTVYSSVWSNSYWVATSLPPKT